MRVSYVPEFCPDRICCGACSSCCWQASFGAQAAAGSLHGQVTDPSGAAVTKADVQVVAPDGKIISSYDQSNRDL